MQFISTQKYLLISPRKVRPVVDLIKKMTPLYALEVLPHVKKKGAQFLEKTIKSALANARTKGVSDTDLVIKEIQISEGPRLKRGNPVSRGQWHAIKKRMSHIRVVLETKEMPKLKAKALTETTKVVAVKGEKGGKGTVGSSSK